MTTIRTGNTITTGFTVDSDNSGDLVLKTGGSGGTTAATFSGATQQATFTAPVSQPGGFSFRNRLINAQGLINQRSYVSGTNTSGANQYTVDRWRVVTSGQNLAFTTSENDTTFTAPAGGVEQVIEGLNLETDTYVLSWTGTATATVGGVSVTNGGTVSVTGGTDTTVRFSNGTFSKPQFEPGTAPTTFERRPYASELALCQRYYQYFGPADVTQGIALLYMATSTSARFQVDLIVPLRTTPSVINIDAGSVNVTARYLNTSFSGYVNYNLPSFSPSYANNRKVSFIYTVGTAGAAGGVGVVYTSARLWFDAEL